MNSLKLGCNAIITMPCVNYDDCSFRPAEVMNNNDCTMQDNHHLANSLNLGGGDQRCLSAPLFLNDCPNRLKR